MAIFFKNFKKFFQGSQTTQVLFFVNVFVSAVLFYLFKDQYGGDSATYLGLADGILHGEYSYWYFLNESYPDTFRNPGYPLFLAAIRFFTSSVLVIQIIQWLLYLFSIRLVLVLLEKLVGRVEVKNIFLLILLPSLYITMYVTMIFPEILVTCLILLSLVVDLKQRNSVWKFVFLGVLYGFIFQIRPAFLFVPFIFFVAKWFLQRRSFMWWKQSVVLIVFVLSMLPYGYWNQRHHGVFKVTSIEGGGGVFHLGYWSFKLPDYYVTHYWNNYCAEEMVPMIAMSEKENYVKLFNEEWIAIENQLAPLLNAKDSAILFQHQSYPGLFPTLNSEYTLRREELLKSATIEHIQSDFPFYLKAKLYGACRLWVTGIPMKEFRSAGFMKKLILLYPFLITVCTFLVALILIPWSFRKYKKEMIVFTPILLLMLYFGSIHLPFTIQSRYTIPVRMELLMCVSMGLYLLVFKRRTIENAS
jgi:hypothetical protein